MGAIVVLFCLLFVAAVTDLRRHKIYNWTTYTGMLAALVLNALGWGTRGTGWASLQDSLAGLIACGFIMLFCFVLFNLGGGDVKLIAMIGAFLGLQQGIEALLWTCVLGGISAVAMLIWQLGFLRIISKTAGHLVLVVRARSWIPLSVEERQPLSRGLYLAPSALVAVGIVLTRHDLWAV